MSTDLARPRSVRFTDQDLELLARLQDRLSRTQREVISLALTHLWESLERDERVYLELRDNKRIAQEEREQEGRDPS